ncbi:MAG: bacillithiol biosynthesis deacetylase BshB1 [Candidatus Nephrothrix sp. EaCA]|nr:MAG: bacillithiol biosynthesis deacetylase BshB1 [Candidatus Nephrothrix sp. EaCA]
MTKIHLLAVGAHPDDVELGCGGTLLKHASMGYSIGIVDLTQGELGTNGSIELRQKEAGHAAAVLGLAVRENLKLQDGFFQHTNEEKLKLVRALRKYQPDVVLGNAYYDRHPDHGRACQLIFEACFLSGLPKVETEADGKKQAPWRPKALYHYIQSLRLKPDFIVDISDFWEQRMKAIHCYSSQFLNSSAGGADTYISNPSFLQMTEGRAADFGHSIGVRYGEGFTVRRVLGIDNLMNIVS